MNKIIGFFKSIFRCFFRPRRSDTQVIVVCFGGFGLSNEALLWLHERKSVYVKLHDEVLYWEGRANDGSRHDPLLVECVKTLGERAFDNYSKLKVVKVYGAYHIDEYDGYENVKSPNDIDWV
jgi:hypothetical protein